MSSRRRAKQARNSDLVNELSLSERVLLRTVRCPECGGAMGEPFRRPDGVVDAVIEHRPGCRTINAIFKEGS